jgi:hypothetical protein
MKPNRFRISTSYTLVLVSLILAAVAVLFLMQEQPAPNPQSTQTTTISSQGAISNIDVQTESKKACGSPSPFGPVDPACETVAKSATTATIADTSDASAAAGDGPDAASVAAAAGGQQSIAAIPDFLKVEIAGAPGNGIVAKLLKSAGRNLAGTPGNSDSMLIDGFAQPNSSVVTAVQDALSRGQYIIVDGGDSTESSAKINQIMLDLDMPHKSGVTAYGISKSPNGAVNVTPLQTLPNEKGGRPIDQIHNILGIEKVNKPN